MSMVSFEAGTNSKIEWSSRRFSGRPTRRGASSEDGWRNYEGLSGGMAGDDVTDGKFARVEIKIVGLITLLLIPFVNSLKEAFYLHNSPYSLPQDKRYDIPWKSTEAD